MEHDIHLFGQIMKNYVTTGRNQNQNEERKNVENYLKSIESALLDENVSLTTIGNEICVSV